MQCGKSPDDAPLIRIYPKVLERSRAQRRESRDFFLFSPVDRAQSRAS